MGKFDGVLILSDMDGTLLNSQAAISEGDGRAIDYFISQGGMFSVATGRAKRSVETFLPGLHTSAPSIVHNGSLIVDLRDDSVFHQIDMEDIVGDMVEDMIAVFPHIAVEVCLPDDQYVVNGNERAESHHKRVKLDYKLKSHEEIPFPWLKLNLIGDPEALIDLKEYVERRYSGHFFGQFSMPYIYEMMANGASKGDSAIWLREHLGVAPENFYTVGDGTNDLELLRASGKNACATANAKDIILENAYIRLPSNDENAIAALIDILDKKY